MPYDPALTTTEHYKGHFIVVTHDDDPLNPREDDCNASTMVCFHRRYDLGDSHEYDEPLTAVADICNVDADDIGRDNEKINETLDKAPLYWLPLFLYDHSGITMKTTPFSCTWDSGQVGIIYITHADAVLNYGACPIPEGKSFEEFVFDNLKAEVAIYDSFITGNCHRFEIYELQEDYEDGGDVMESCGNFLGSSNNCLEEARSEVDAICVNK